MRIVKIEEVKTNDSTFGRKTKSLLTNAEGAKHIAISWIQFPPHVELEKHSREGEEILIPLEGKGYIKMEKGEFPISPGMIVYFAPGDVHSHCTKDESLTQLVLFAPPLKR